jgi:hypothetical protein
MAVVRFYLTPYGPGYIPSRPQANASKVVLYLSGDDAHMVVRANPWKSWCLCYVDAQDATHAAIQADAEITLIPLWDSGNNYLPMTAAVNEIAEPYRTQIATFLEDHYVPMAWVTGTTLIGQVFRHIVQILKIIHWLGEDYPNFDLETPVSDIPAQQRTRILSWMNSNGIQTNDITNSWTIRQVLRRIVRDFGWRPTYKFGTVLL